MINNDLLGCPGATLNKRKSSEQPQGRAAALRGENDGSQWMLPEILQVLLLYVKVLKHLTCREHSSVDCRMKPLSGGHTGIE